MKKKLWIPTLAVSATLALVGVSLATASAIKSSATPEAKDFTVHVMFVNYDGTVLYETDTAYGSDAVYVGSAPVHPEEEGMRFDFSGWDKPLGNVTQDTLFRAQFDVSYLTQTATFLNIDGTYLWSTSVRYGEDPVYGGPVPTYSTIEGVTYTWNGQWDKPLTRLTRDTTFVARYNRFDSRHRCTFYDGNGNILKTEFVVDGASATAPAFPSTEVYAYEDGPSRYVTAYAWSNKVDGITSDTDFYPVFPSYQDAGIGVYYDEAYEGYILNSIYDAGEYLTGEQLTLPTTYHGLPIVGFRSWTGNNLDAARILIVPEGYRVLCAPLANLIHVAIPSSLEILENGCFMNSSSLTTISFSGTSHLKRIESNAFYGTGLTEFDVPDSVEYIAYDAFDHTPMAAQVYSENGATYLPLGFDRTMITSISSLKDLLTAGIPDSCIGLRFEQLYDPNGQTRITTSISSWSFGKNVRFVLGRPLEACIAENKEVTIPASMRYFECGDVGLSKLRFLGNMDQYFSLTVESRPYSVAQLFIGEDEISEVTVPDSVKEIPDGMFRYCHGIKKVTLPNGIKRIGSSAFEGCAIEEITLPDSLEAIDAFAFASNQLKTLVIPSLGDRLGFGAFGSNYQLRSISLTSGTTIIPSECFVGCPIDMVSLPSSVKELGHRAFSDGTAINFTAGLDQFLACDSKLKIEAGYSDRYTLYFNGQEAKNIVLPASFTAVREAMFAGFTNIESVQILGDLRYIGSRAFEGCESLKSLQFPNTLAHFSGDAFAGCTQLVNLEFDNNPNFTVIDGDVYNRKGNVLLLANSSKSGTYAVRDGVTEIGDGALALSLGINALTVPSSVRMIGSRLFASDSIQSVDIAEGTTVISPSAFANATNNTTNIETLYLPASLRTVESMLNDTYVQALHLAAGFAANLSSFSMGWHSVQSTYYHGSFDRFIADLAPKSQYFYGALYCLNDEEYVQPSWNDVMPLTKISDGSFNGAQFGNNEEFVSSTLRSVGYSGLSSTNIVSMTLSSLHYAGQWAFANNSMLQFVDLRGSTLPYLNPYAFTSCGNLHMALLNDGLRHIGERAFADIYLPEDNPLTILVPKSLKYVDGEAFTNSVRILLPEEGLDESVFDEARDYLASFVEPRSLTLVPYMETAVSGMLCWNYGADGVPVVHEA